ncbi:hypothetical protein SCP_0101120 [Sparassis crispa]|uniref:Uncharacterized protein n=1 Tax=Sparassis crispa TaxID=139825 RepID=A0A401G503_9APHY|nr:hypothetical protein SCP_0101120 [Sparassis crispa]GBE77239.1 hypothetical protein SCP_0101120 [Sparassis crispa]
MGPSRRRHITRTKRALMRSMRSQNYSVRDISQWLACGESTVGKVLRNDYGDSLEEDVDHLDGRAGDITNVDNMSEDSIARTLATLKDEDEDLEYVEDATSTRDDESDNHPSISTAAQGARKSARLRGQKAPCEIFNYLCYFLL